MQLDRPLATVTPTVDGDVLAVLALADAAFTPPEVHRLVDRHSVSGVRNALNRLVEQGVVEAETVGRAVRYQLNREHLAAAAVTELANLRSVLVERIRSLVSTWDVPPVLVMIFGSAANGAMRTDSDIDLFAVADEPNVTNRHWRAQIAELEASVGRWTGNDVRTLEYSTGDLSHPDDPVIADIARHGIVVVGDRELLRPGRKAPA